MKTLSELEQIIDEGLATFIAVGSALMTIRDERLYASLGFDSFDAYCKARFPRLSRSRRYQYMSAAASAALLGIDDAPESHLRELAKLPDAYKPLCWDIAKQAAAQSDVPLTASVIRKTADVVIETFITQSVSLAGEQLSLSDIIRNQVSEEVVEARRQQRLHMKNTGKLVARLRAVVDSAGLHLLDAPDLPPATYTILFYVHEEQPQCN
jgi:hypothetical protein